MLNRQVLTGLVTASLLAGGGIMSQNSRQEVLKEVKLAIRECQDLLNLKFEELNTEIARHDEDAIKISLMTKNFLSRSSEEFKSEGTFELGEIFVQASKIDDNAKILADKLAELEKIEAELEEKKTDDTTSFTCPFERK